MSTFDEMLKKENPPVPQEKTKVEEIRDTYNQLVDAQKMYSVKAMTWFSKYFQQIFMVVLSFLLIGIQQFAEPKFDPYFFTRPKFWYEYLPFVTALWLILFATTSGAFKILMEEDLAYIQLKNEIQAHVDSDSKNPYIEVGSKIDDRDRKKRAYKRDISRKIEKKIKKYNIGTFDNFMVYIGVVELGATLSSGNDLMLSGINIPKRREKRIKGSLRALYDKLDDVYIDKIIDNTKIKYTQVNASLLINGFSPRTKETYVPNYKSNDQTEVIGEFGVGQLVTMILMFIILSLDLIEKEANISTWVFFTLKMFQLTWTYFKGSMRSKPIFDRTHKKALQERNSTLNEYKKKYQVIEKKEPSLN